MKEKFFYLTMAAIAALCISACSSDDDDAGSESATESLTTPLFAEQAAHYELLDLLKPADADAPLLKAIDFSESGKILVELVDPADNRLSYVTDNAIFSGHVITANGTKIKGSVNIAVTKVRTRATDSQMVVSLSVTLSDGQTVTYDNSNDETGGTVVTTGAADDEASARLARTWNVLGAILDLKSKSQNVKAYEEFSSRGGLFYMEDVLVEAINQGVELTPKEQEEFKRVVKSITITKTGLFVVNYVDGNDDVAQWEWANDQKTAITIRLMDEEMGNKFISDNTWIDIAYKGNRCNLRMETALTDDDNNDWESVLTLQLQE